MKMTINISYFNLLTQLLMRLSVTFKAIISLKHCSHSNVQI